MRIRDAVNEDLPDLLRIYNDAIAKSTATFDTSQLTLEERAVWFSHYGGPHPLLVSEEDGKVTGYGSLSRFRDKDGFARTVEISIYVDESWRGKGIGKALLQELLRRGKELGHHVVVAGITGGNAVSTNLHKAHGFQYVGRFREVGHKFGEWQDVDFYQLILQNE